jgi:hypothetical protein
LAHWLFDEKDPNLPELAFSTGVSDFQLLRLNNNTGEFSWREEEKKQYRPRRPIILFDSHGSCKTQNENEENSVKWKESYGSLELVCKHYEPYITNDPTGYSATSALDQIDKGDSKSSLKPPSVGLAFIEAAMTKVLIVDERIDPTSSQLMTDDRFQWTCSYKELFSWKGVDIRGGEYGLESIRDDSLLMGWVENKGYDFIVLHKGIVDKLAQTEEGDLPSKRERMSELFEKLRKHVPHIVIHSGRMAMSELPLGVKSMSFSNVDIWIRNNYPKVRIIEDLSLLRRV